MFWVAREHGSIIGLLVVTLPAADAINSAINKLERCFYIHLAYTADNRRGTGVCTALLERMLAWARERNFPVCSVEWQTANVAAASFWQHGGFRAMPQMLFQHVDERIAWAHG